MSECDCNARVIKTIITLKNGLYEGEYHFEMSADRRLVDMVHHRTFDFSELIFPGAAICPIKYLSIDDNF